MANTNPIYTNTPVIGCANLTGSIANTASSGAGTIASTMFTAFTAGSNGSYVVFARISGTANTASTTMTASQVRLYVSSQTSGSTTSANTWLIQEVSVTAIVVDNPNVAIPFIQVPLNFSLPANYTIQASTHAAVASNTTWQVVVFGGNY